MQHRTGNDNIKGRHLNGVIADVHLHHFGLD